MAISKMKKVSLLISKDDKDRILREVVFFNGIETLFPDEYENDGSCLDDVEEKITECEKNISLLKSALDIIAKYRQKRRKLSDRIFSRKEFEALEYKVASALEDAKNIENISKTIKAFKNNENSLERKIKSLEMWQALDIPLSFEATEKTIVERAVLPAASDMEKVDEVFDESGVWYEKIGADTSGIYILAVILKENERLFRKNIVKIGYTPFVYQSELSAKEETKELKAEIKKSFDETEKLKNQLSEFAEKAGDLEESFDFLNFILEELKVKQKLFMSKTTVMLCGWIPENRISKFEKILENTVCFYEFEEPSQDESPPIELLNNKIVSPFEEVISMYSYPDYRGIDPTMIMSFFYFVIFGFMLADVGYGVILTLACLVMMKVMKAKGTFKRYLQLFAICGISTALAGMLFGGYFGDLPSVVSENMLNTGALKTELWFNPVQDPITFLILSIAIGAVHLLAGMVIQAYMLIKRGKVFDAIFDIGSWFLVFGGLIIWLLLGAGFGKWVTVAGLASLILTQGRREKNIIMKFLKGLLSLYDIVNYISDLLSYSRILALALASAVVASVVNIMATLFGPSPVGYIFMTVVLIFGHTLNLVINLLGTFVHTSRLQYIEFFGKFYEDGGMPFKPAAPKLKYTQITEK